jgi:RNA polymerase sigma-70 factor, ECF subfamily
LRGSAHPLDEMPPTPVRSAARPARGEPFRLVEAKADNDVTPASLEHLFRSYSSYVAAIALRLLGRDEDVDDVVQDVFLSAWKGAANLRDPGAIKGWLATVTVRTARRRLKMRRVKMFLRLDDDPDYGNVAAPGASPEEKALLSRIYQVLDGLPVDQRMAWTLRYVEREQLDDVARLCDVSLATAKRKITAAQQAISAALGDVETSSEQRS